MPVSWVYARDWSGWNMSWTGFFGGLPKLDIVCGSCGRHSKSRANESRSGAVYAWCSHCGMANVARGLVVC
jgi:hypothetical protein